LVAHSQLLPDACPERRPRGRVAPPCRLLPHAFPQSRPLLAGQFAGNRLIFLVPQRAELVLLLLARLPGQGLVFCRKRLTDLLDLLPLLVTQVEVASGRLPLRFPFGLEDLLHLAPVLGGEHLAHRLALFLVRGLQLTPKRIRLMSEGRVNLVDLLLLLGTETQPGGQGVQAAVLRRTP